MVDDRSLVDREVTDDVTIEAPPEPPPTMAQLAAAAEVCWPDFALRDGVPRRVSARDPSVTAPAAVDLTDLVSDPDEPALTAAAARIARTWHAALATQLPHGDAIDVTATRQDGCLVVAVKGALAQPGEPDERAERMPAARLAAVARLVWPELTDVEGCTLLADRYEPANFERWSARTGGDTSEMEAVLNETHLYDEIADAADLTTLEAVARRMTASWRARLAGHAAGRRFDVLYGTEPDQYGPTLTFRHRMGTDEGGQTSVEYVGIIVVIATIVTALFAIGLAPTIGSRLVHSVEAAIGRSATAGGGAASGSSGGGGAANGGASGAPGGPGGPSAAGTGASSAGAGPGGSGGAGGGGGAAGPGAAGAGGAAALGNGGSGSTADQLLSGAKQWSGDFPKTADPNQVLYRVDPQTGKYTNYQVFDGDGNPLYRVDLAGRAHGGIETPHVQYYTKNTAPDGKTYVNKGGVEPATADQVPTDPGPPAGPGGPADGGGSGPEGPGGGSGGGSGGSGGGSGGSGGGSGGSGASGGSSPANGAGGSGAVDAGGGAAADGGGAAGAGGAAVDAGGAAATDAAGGAAADAGGAELLDLLALALL